MDNSYYNGLTASCAADRRQVFRKGAYRFTVITSKLLRVEKNENGNFCDDATQTVINRNFVLPFYIYSTENGVTEIKTDDCVFRFDINKGRMLSITLCDGRTVTDYKKGNLKGTCRTLDNTSGEKKLDSRTGRVAVGDGIVSKDGVAVLDDSKSLLIDKSGEILPRSEKEKDEYYFAYGYDYRGAVADFFNLTGHPVLIPRFALGNWWSRYRAYTQDEYETLINRFAEEKIPLTVATIDMDWHWTDVEGRFGRAARDRYLKASPYEMLYLVGMPGWTGYSWNTELFPDPKGFLKGLKDKNLKVTMNLHPHSGCRFFEDAYDEFADFMGADKEKKEQIMFDITDSKFREGYFRFLHHPHEKDGVDFWWIDWQQSHRTNTPGLDPLWALNHYHTVDNARNGNRPLVLSRFAGAGSHRYPLGFSGDTFQTWQSLDYQPEFTATSTNIGYTWWSHDIGGHCFGKRDDELYLRWVQYGVFSPVNRLHSTSNEFMGKEPWKYGPEVRRCATEYLRLRKRLIPYIYTMNRLTEKYGRALIEPMYYESPRDERAYTCPNEYYFGTELIVAPVTCPADKKTGFAPARVFLPEGRYTDIFTGMVYTGGRVLDMYRDCASIPVLAKAGAIIPLDRDDTANGSENPAALDVLVYRGNGEFTMYEDDGFSFSYKNGAYAETVFRTKEDGKTVSFSIGPVAGDLSVLPEKRGLKVIFKDITGFAEAVLYKNGKKSRESHTEIIDGCAVLTLRAYDPACGYEVTLTEAEARKNPEKREMLTDVISKYRANNNYKMGRFTNYVVKGEKTKLPKELRGIADEIDILTE